ncbi:phospholipase D family protein [Ruegeria profundi]|uniref:phospholipase D family protein n=1 Tax=Ruegeria profundi TaxID=1685378 RepID=UPI001CD48CF8|nr:phospholipase D family protein [Ruegeria profundi]MCA0928821.1 phospholipase D family protein [Ruegeria profundi]
MRFLRFILAFGILIAITIFALRLLFPLPDQVDRIDSARIPATAETKLGAATLSAMASHPGKSGTSSLADGREAYAARVLLARAAEQSIDLQYYIWQTDTTGWILLDEVRKAAERGVRVRLLLDDNGIPGLDEELSALNALPNVEIRLFNPFTLRSPKLLSYLFDFPRLNRRMHNKSMTVDGAATVLGGRNIGNIYFDYGSGVHYFDADVLAIGPVVEDVSEDFDRYWASASAYPAELILENAPDGFASLTNNTEEAWASAFASEYIEVIKNTPLVQKIESGTLELEWGKVEFFSDDPAKGLGKADQDDLLLARVIEIAQPQKSFDLVSAYFIPGELGTDILTEFSTDGIKTRTVTNALSATDVPPVHSAYMKYRLALVEAGVEVLELRQQAERPKERNLSSMIVGSASSLHAKTFAVDGEKIFVGSFNFDPRSAQLNTEMGVLIPSARMAQGLAAVLDEASQFYRVQRSEGGDLVWTETAVDGREIILTEEPETGVVQRWIVWFISWLPVEWML